MTSLCSEKSHVTDQLARLIKLKANLVGPEPRGLGRGGKLGQPGQRCPGPLGPFRPPKLKGEGMWSVGLHDKRGFM